MVSNKIIRGSLQKSISLLCTKPFVDFGIFTSINPINSTIMNRKHLHLIAGFAVVLLLSLISCQKSNQDDNPGLVQDNAMAEALFSEVKDIADEAWMQSSSSGKSGMETEWVIIGLCATITHDTTVSPKTLTIDFGQVNCLCADGKNRRGIIQISYSGRYRDSGTVITHTFNNYFVNDNQILGTKTVTNNGTNQNGHINYSVVVSGSILKANNGGTITWNSNRTREWIAGSTTPTWLDDVYLITGTASGTSASNTSYTMVITNPLRKEIGCKYFVSGTLEITPAGKPVRLIDYGNGACDNIITVTINGNTFTILL
jgi:hypothetical protein